MNIFNLFRKHGKAAHGVSRATYDAVRQHAIDAKQEFINVYGYSPENPRDWEKVAEIAANHVGK